MSNLHSIIKKSSNNRKALILLHEIYGINRFMEDICMEYHVLGFDIFCPDMLNGNSFEYSEASRAYTFFTNCIGFDYYVKIELLLESLKGTYDKVLIMGVSIGATMAWRCSQNAECDGIICCYGSRIRDYLYLQPACPALVIFAEKDSFNVGDISEQILKKRNVELHKFRANHGFLDPYSHCFNKEEAQAAHELYKGFS